MAEPKPNDPTDRSQTDRAQRASAARLTAVLIGLAGAAGLAAGAHRAAGAGPALGAGPAAGAGPAPSSAPAGSTDLAAGLALADSTLLAAVAAESIPGAVLLVARDGAVIHERAYGYARLYAVPDDAAGGDAVLPTEVADSAAGADSAQGVDPGGSVASAEAAASVETSPAARVRPRRLPRPEPMTTAHLFDLASVTKAVATTFAAMLLVDRGRIALDSPVRRYLPGFRGPRRDSITVRHLLTHTSGLARWKPTYYHAADAEGAYDYIRGLPLRWDVGAGRRYSDLGFMLLGSIVERVSGRPLEGFLRENLYGPLGLRATGFKPRSRGFDRFAATSHGNPFERRMVADDDFGYRIDDVDAGAFDGWRDYTLSGEVNDGNAWYAHGGVAGHAGLFSTARELHVLLELLLGRGAYDGRRLIDADIVDRFLSPGPFGNGLGWGMAPGVVGLDEPPPGTFAHGGFTGTYVMGVPAYDLAVVLLTNRQNIPPGPDGRYTDVGALRRPVLEGILRAAATAAAAR